MMTSEHIEEEGTVMNVVNAEPITVTKPIKQEAMTATNVQNVLNAQTNVPLSRFVPLNLPQNVGPNGAIFIPQNQAFVPRQLISGTNHAPHQFVPISAPISNPTLPPPTNANAPPAALIAFQNQLMNISANKDPNSAVKSEALQLPKPPQQQNIVKQQQPQQAQGMTYFQQPQQSIYFPQQPKNPKDEILNENWSAKIAYAATLSSIINASATLYRERSEIALKPNWAELLYKLNGKDSKNETNKESEQSQGDNQQNVFDEAIEHIFKTSEFFLCEISTKMAETKITEAIGMMKGLTDAVCNLITNASMHLPGSNLDKMRQLFENKLLVMWCSLLLRATTDVREAMQRYLTHEAFNAYYYYKTALNNEFYKHLSSDEKLLVSLRTKKEQYDFEENTKKICGRGEYEFIGCKKDYGVTASRSDKYDGNNGPKATL